MINSKKAYILIIVLLPTWLTAQNLKPSKSDRYYSALIEKRDVGAIRMYGVYDFADSSISKLTREKVELAMKLREKLREKLSAIVEDTLFSVYAQLHLKTQNCFTIMESTPRYLNGYAVLVKKMNSATDQMSRIIAKDRDLVRIEAYTEENEFVFLRRYFLYRSAFEPRDVDECRVKTNPTQHRVLFDVNFGDKLSTSRTDFGMAESKQYTFISVPVIDGGKYVCDVEFMFLR